MFYFEEIKDKKILKSDYLSGLEHFFTTRESNVGENSELLCEYLNISEENLISPVQTHSCNIAIAKKGQNYDNVDALILSEKNLAIYLRFADCTPIIIYDEVKNIGAISHAGWRGTAQEIAPKTVLKMVKDFSCNVDNISVAIGPAIGQCCYCVGEECYKQLKSTLRDESECFRFENDKIYTNLKKINYHQLKTVGVKKIDICDYCTSCDNDLFFSYRKENGTQYRHNAVIKLK